MKAIVQIIGSTAGIPTPHDGKWLVEWNPHTYYGACDIATTDDPKEAKVFDGPIHVMKEWRIVSAVQAIRPTDGLPNRPLTGLSIMIQNAEALLDE